MLCVGSGWRLDRPARIGPRVSASRYRQGLEPTLSGRSFVLEAVTRRGGKWPDEGLSADRIGPIVAQWARPAPPGENYWLGAQNAAVNCAQILVVSVAKSSAW